MLSEQSNTYDRDQRRETKTNTLNNFNLMAFGLRMREKGGKVASRDWVLGFLKKQENIGL